jgi:hypothetical protein
MSYTLKLDENGSIKVDGDADTAATHFTKYILVLLSALGVQYSFAHDSAISSVSFSTSTGDLRWYNRNEQQEHSVNIRNTSLRNMLAEGLGTANQLIDITQHDQQMATRVQSILDAIAGAKGSIETKIDAITVDPPDLTPVIDAVEEGRKEVRAAALAELMPMLQNKHKVKVLREFFEVMSCPELKDCFNNNTNWAYIDKLVRRA